MRSEPLLEPLDRRADRPLSHIEVVKLKNAINAARTEADFAQAANLEPSSRLGHVEIEPTGGWLFRSAGGQLYRIEFFNELGLPASWRSISSDEIFRITRLTNER